MSGQLQENVGGPNDQTIPPYREPTVRVPVLVEEQSRARSARADRVLMEHLTMVDPPPWLALVEWVVEPNKAVAGPATVQGYTEEQFHECLSDVVPPHTAFRLAVLRRDGRWTPQVEALRSRLGIQ